MTGLDLPQAVRYLIARYIDSVQQVEILRLLAREPDREWTTGEVSRALRIAPDPCEAWLARFAEAGLVARGRGVYRHGTPVDGAPGPVEELLECFGARRLAIIDFIYSKPENDATGAVP
jgi:hypothetical protein